ncbi:hypothetical protein TNCV_3917771 [Trichonephila clavipes]|nr:hypothetical protein TNCV_3917771 [Trichonephila clavipes]
MAPHIIPPAVQRFRCSPVSCTTLNGGVKGSTSNKRHNPKCPTARRHHMVQEDTRAPSEGATCAWMAANEAVNCTCAFLTMWWSC